MASLSATVCGDTGARVTDLSLGASVTALDEFAAAIVDETALSGGAFLRRARCDAFSFASASLASGAVGSSSSVRMSAFDQFASVVEVSAFAASESARGSWKAADAFAVGASGSGGRASAVVCLRSASENLAAVVNCTAVRIPERFASVRVLGSARIALVVVHVGSLEAGLRDIVSTERA